MSEVNKEKDKKTTANNVVKKTRRGISNETKSTSRLKFDDRRDANPTNGLFSGHLENVTVTEVNVGEEVTGTPSFAGLSIPKLILTFASDHPNIEERRYVTKQFTPVESNVDTIPGGKDEWKINGPMGFLKHILNIYILKGKEMTSEQEDALTLAYEDFNENMEYVTVEPEVVISAWYALFNNFANMMNMGKDGKEAFKTSDGKHIPVWIKLLRYYKTKAGWKPVDNGNLGFPSFVGEGVIEIRKAQVIPTLRVDVTKESIRPMDVAKTPTNPAVPVMSGVPINGGPVMPNNMGEPIPNFDGVAEDLPF